MNGVSPRERSKTFEIIHRSTESCDVPADYSFALAHHLFPFYDSILPFGNILGHYMLEYIICFLALQSVTINRLP